MRWYRKAADQGDAFAQTGIGCLYHDGLGVPQDYAEAMRWYRKAADQGNAFTSLIATGILSPDSSARKPLCRRWWNGRGAQAIRSRFCLEGSLTF